MFTLLRGSNRRDRIYEYRVKYAVITLSCAVRSMKTAGNFINECGTRNAPWFDEKTRSLLSFFPRRNWKFSEFLFSSSSFFVGKRKRKKSEVTRGGRDTGTRLVARVYIHLAREYDCIKECTRSVYQSGTSRAVKFRPVASSSSRFVASLSSGERRCSKEEDETKPLYGWPFPPVMGNVQAAPRHAAKIYSAPRASAQRVSLAIYERTLLKFRLIVQGRSTRSRTRKREREANEVRSVLLSSRTIERRSII